MLRAAHEPFKAYLPGYLHMDVKYLPQMADETGRSDLGASKSLGSPAMGEFALS